MKKVFMFLIILFFGLCLPIFTFAEVTEENPLLPDSLMPGMIESTGTHFEVNNSDYLNIILESSEAITLRLESVPEMITMFIESASDATSSQITISGFQPLTTYYKYEDDYHSEEVFTTDGNGSYSWTQDLSQLHLVFIQPRKSTKFIKDDATGGDCYLIGIWDSPTKTCTLTTDVYETIQIDSNYITLDGNGRTITGTGTGYGVYLYGRTGISIKNLNVNNFTYGVSLYYSSNNTLTDNTASNSNLGIFLRSSNNNTLIGNIASNNLYGIGLYYSRDNTLIDNITQENPAYDLYVAASLDSHCNNIIQNTTGSGGRPIKYFNSPVNLENETLSELILCNADYSNITNVTIAGSETLGNNGLLVFRTDYSSITNTNSSDNRYGIWLDSSSNDALTGNITSNNYFGTFLSFSSNNTLTNNTAANNVSGIYLSSSSNNTLTGNTTSNNSYGIIFSYYCNNNTLTDNTTSNNVDGISLSWYSNNNTLTGNIASNNNSDGIDLYYSSNNQIYNNNFITNGTQAHVASGSGNVFNLEKPTGGNYWSNFDTPAKGCYDTNNDGFCDTPYYFTNGADYLPWTKQSGWEVPADTTPPTTTVTLSGNLGNNSWYVSDVQLTLTAVDNAGGSGVKKTEYSFNGVNWTTYLAPFTISSEGTTTVYHRSTDNAGNVETTKSTSVKIDKTSPTITATASPIPNANGWNNTDVAVSFICSDSTSGIASCPSPITVTTEGAGQAITGTSVDKAGNTATTSVTLNIDKTPPVANISANPGFLWPPNHKMVDVRIDGSAIDEESGIASVVITVTDEYGIYNITVPKFGSPIQLEAWREGTDKDGRIYTITVVATDRAGNQSTAITQVIVPHDMRK